LRAIKTLDDYLAFVSQHMFRHQLFDWPQCKIIVDVALGDFDSARSICKENLQRWSIDRPNYDEDDRAENRRLRAKLAEETAWASRASCTNGRLTPSKTSRSNTSGSRHRFRWNC
jgi:hypothetical protein